MDNNQARYLTREGLEKIQEELTQLKNVKRREIADRIQQAKELGDLSENAEYVEAKNEQGFVEGRIMELENLSRNAIVINRTRGGDVVTIGSTIVVESGGEEHEYLIVGSSEADPANGRISNESPLGKAFLGKHVGETTEIATPRGTTVYSIKRVK
ncbi:MAG: transcription elongation factor GreA [Candidatus Kerfeldbacteria bacterium]|nr:transcription elongation factor GreA [Candidatus Kerfeldbacteria bacterium]